MRTPLRPRGGRRRRPHGRRGTALRAVLATLVAVTALVLGSSVLLGVDVRLAPLLAFLPAFAAIFGTVAQTVLAAVWATAAVSTAYSYLSDRSGVTSLVAAGFCAVLGGLSVEACRRRIHREEELGRLRSTAAALQRQILRPLPLLTDRLLVGGLYDPVESDILVGGDIYEVVASPYGSRVLIGDVQGKGLAAIGTGFAVLGAFREAAYREPTLTAVVDALEDAVVRHNTYALGEGEQERFVTALVLGVDGATSCQAVNCGHITPHLLDGDGARTVPLGEPGVPLGLERLAAVPRTVAWFDFPRDSALLLCTDGVTEARDRHGSFYPLTERLARWAGRSVPEVTEALRDDLDSYTAGVHRDDIAVLLVRRTAAA
ncbi:serine/threonine-protein phosphatase [Streptacidiphilus sp. ASG 303]|uniref:PP2C family protein-serine/threonine phosphatase n=1 Tax=Streptacidiphilus sp. ASG 303 TaxID=2896847 RepID=UPI001E44C17C|nr:PP2C family protein-serine/threonine phosphatase [Streptacidiphilus sp. ASG 303]MCD0484478.1 serine/threonine-protein phosphatase [Streptacidiphilus sp. ASG 303]